MEEPAQDPLDLVKQLVLLIVEARTPDFSAKGRVEGPHCPIIRGGPPHLCSRDKKECFRAREFCRSAQQLWTNEIPICIDILLFPNCPCGWEEVKVTEGAVTSVADENALLLERWMVVSEKRRHDSGLGSNLLLQAVRSYLHFSQISSWLFSEKGKLPNLLAYRIYAPGEESSLDFLLTPDTHAFPYCILRYDSIKVTVSAMRRVSQIPVLLCASESHEQDELWGSESSVKGELFTRKLSRSELMDEYEELMGDLKGHPICNAQKSPSNKEMAKAKVILQKQKPRSRKTSKQQFLHDSKSYDVQHGALRWNENLSILSKSKVKYFCEGNYPGRKDGTGKDKVYHKEILKEHKNGTEEARVFFPEKSGDWMQEILNPKGSCGKKDGEKDQRIEQMKCDGIFVEGTKKAEFNNSMDKKAHDTKSKKFLKKHDMDVSYLMIDDPASQKEQFWTNFSTGFGGNSVDCQAAHAAYWFHKENEEKEGLDKRMERSTNAVCNERSLQKFQRDTQIETLLEKPRSQMFSADDAERKSNLAASEGNEDDFIYRLSERMTLGQTKPFVTSHSAGTKALPFTLGHKFQDLKTSTDHDFHEKRDNLITCVRQHNTLWSAWPHCPKSPSITNVTKTTLSGQNFQVLPDKDKNAQNVECMENNVCNTDKLIQPLSQLTVDISSSDFEMEWDSDNTPTASPNHLSSCRANGSSLCKAVTARQMIGAVNSGAHNLDKKDIAVLGQGFESVIQNKISPFKSGENKFHDNSFATSSSPILQTKVNVQKDAIFYPSREISPDEAESILNKRNCSENLSSRNDVMATNNDVRPQGTSRKIFEENLLPLASYDAQTDSFKMVDPTNQVKVLHSPKVLLSCDVPTEEVISSEIGRCINFEKEVDSELFMSQLQEIMPSQGLPHSIGSYMSHLAAMSLSEEHKKEPAAHGSSGICLDENKANDLEDTQSKVSFIKDSNVYEPKLKGQADKVSQLVVVRDKAAFDKDNQEGERRMDLEKEKGFDPKKGLRNYDNVDDCTVEEDVKEHRNISDKTFINSNVFSVHEVYSNRCMEKKYKKHDAESCIFKNLIEESGMSEHKKQVARCLDLHPFGIKNKTQLETSFKDGSQCLSDCKLEPCDTTLSDSDCPDHNSLLTTKDCSPLASSPLPPSLSPSQSSSSSKLTKSNPLSSDLLPSPSSTSSNHSPPSASSSLTALDSHMFHHYSDTGHKEIKDFKTSTEHGQISRLENSTNDSPQFISNFSTIDREMVSWSCDRDKHSSYILSTNGNQQLDNPSSSLTTSQRPSKHGDNISADVSALASLSMVGAENQPHSQELLMLRSPTQTCHTGTKSSDHAFINTPNQRDCVACKSIDKRENGISSSLNKMFIPHSSLCLVSSSNVDKYITFNDSPSELTSNDTESALKVIPYNSSLDSESCSRSSTDGVSNYSCPFMNSALKHPQLSSVLNTKSHTSCGRVNMSHKCSDIHGIKGSNFSNVNAINNLQASQSLSFQTICDNEGRRSSTFHASENMNSNDSLSSNGIEFSKTTSSHYEDISIQQVIKKSTLTVNESQNSISEEDICKNKNEGNTPPASSSPERILNHSKCNQASSQARISHEDMIECQKLHSTQVKAFNGLPLKDLHRKSMNSTSHTCGSDSELCHLNGKRQSQIGHRFIEAKAKADIIRSKEKTLRAQSGRSSEDSDNTEVFYLKENAAPNVPEICPTTYSGCLASSLMLSSSSCVLLDTPFSSLSAATTCKSSSLSTEAGMDLECSPNHDLDQGVFGRSRMSSYSESLPGWTPNPPHRSMSTPDCAERDVRGRGYQRSTCSRSTSVLQQSDKDGISARRAALMSSSMIFNSRTALPTQSSPAPLKRKSGARFDYDASLLNVRAIKNAFSCSKLALGDNKEDDTNEDNARTLSTSAPASTNCLLGNFEESILNGRIDPVGTVDGFSAEIGASGSFCPKHLHLPVSAFFFALSDDNAPSPYLGHINLNAISKKGYHIPKKGTVQVTLFNPNKTVVKMFVVMYDLSDMPPSSQTFIRQRTMYIPTEKDSKAPSYLRYLIHLRCSSSRSGKIYLHTDIRLIFARHKLDIDAKTVSYEMKSYTDAPRNPKYSPKK